MSRNDIQFSIIIPAYNASSCIKDTLDSVKNQTYKNYEVLITNDGSTDNTEEILKSYKKSNPEFPLNYVNQKNSGVSSARNSSISMANGNYIAFLDQDDWWFPDKLEKIAGFINSNPEADVLYHEAIAVGLKKSDVSTRLGALKEPVYLDLLFNGNKIGISTAVIKTQRFLETEGFSKDYSISEDYDLWLRLARKNTCFLYIPDFLSKYVWHEDSESNRVEEMTREKLEIFENNYRFILSEGKYDRRYLEKNYKRGNSILLFGASRKL